MVNFMTSVEKGPVVKLKSVYVLLINHIPNTTPIAPIRCTVQRNLFYNALLCITNFKFKSHNQCFYPQMII